MLGQTLRIATSSLLASRTRTILTTVGITIGVACILLVFAVGEGARTKAGESVATIPDATALLRSGSDVTPAPSSLFEPRAGRTAPVFTEHDLATLNDAKLVTKSAPIMEVAGSVGRKETRDAAAFIAGTDGSLFGLLGTRFVDGGTFDAGAIGGDNPQKSAVIGNEVSEKLFGTELASGQILTIRGEDYTVTGVLAHTDLPTDATGVPVNDTAFIPLGQAKSYTNGVAAFPLVFIGADRSQENAVRAQLTRNHGNQTDFTIARSSSINSGDSALLATIIAVTSFTAAVSLVIGGIGIMNIMLVNVSERTREIGIRKSIGASSGNIMAQFLVEAAVMSLAGGLLGCLVALVVGVIAGLFLPFGILFTPSAVALVIGLSVVIGIVFGLYPAIRASRKDTIEALRYYQ